MASNVEWHVQHRSQMSIYFRNCQTADTEASRQANKQMPLQHRLRITGTSESEQVNRSDLLILSNDMTQPIDRLTRHGSPSMAKRMDDRRPNDGRICCWCNARTYKLPARNNSNDDDDWWMLDSTRATVIEPTNFHLFFNHCFYCGQNGRAHDGIEWLLKKTPRRIDGKWLAEIAGREARASSINQLEKHCRSLFPTVPHNVFFFFSSLLFAMLRCCWPPSVEPPRFRQLFVCLSVSTAATLLSENWIQLRHFVVCIRPPLVNRWVGIRSSDGVTPAFGPWYNGMNSLCDVDAARAN